ncbi:hypothetical protein Back11_12940 [Paenibacillus baekrokdamisoli]|uniref:DUF58 domain-containing protein n=1 Tax=Paenibacillus baekrokdamisoli TaxID=1712516 RepID=A0A3G9JAC3_9BACL|nr:DUF58 domain-containing protein [Paenibacillus baekrokdamisoli]MBB3070599.1 uncharacterized protein (DUF58 family) [Paenibacillus baekrokdamisoli]BBH19949.1 hypothetical protein Back11_12940 [Paenibacillus baekrokdamisoli]
MGIHWYILSAIVVIIIQQFVFRRFGMKKLTYERRFSVSHCFEGERIEMIERLTNSKSLPVPWLRVESLLHTGLKFERNANFDVSSGQFYQNHKSLFSLMGNKQLTRRHSVQCVQRGFYRLSSASLSYGDLFGMFSSHVKLPLKEELVVYPQPVDYSELNFPSRSFQGDIAVRRWIVEDPFTISGVRDYHSGDSLKTINWNATARAGKLQVHRRDFTADYRLMILLNVEDHAEMWDVVKDTELIEQGIRMAAALVQYATEQGLETGFAANGHEIDVPGMPMTVERSSGNEHLLHILEQMAKLVIVREVPFDALLHQLTERWQDEDSYDVVIVSAFMSEKIELAIDKMRSGGHSVDWMPINLVRVGDSA